LKIAIFHFGVYKKGGWGRTFSLAKGLALNGCDVTIITSDIKKGLIPIKDYKEGVNIVKVKDIVPFKILSKGFGFLSFISKLLYAIFHEFNIVHADSHRPNAYYPCIINRSIYKSKFIIEWWDNFGFDGQLQNKSKLFKTFLGKWEANTEIISKLKANGVVVLSKAMKEKAKLNGINDYKIKIIYGGADIEHIKYIQLSNNHIREDKYNNYQLIFGYIGYGDNDIDDLICFLEAFKLASLYHSLLFINYGDSFSQKYIDNYSVNNNIINYGWIDYYKDASLLSIPDIYILIKNNNNINRYGWPNKLGDYMACGRAIMINKYGDLSDVVSNYPNGFIIVKNEVENINKAIDDIINNYYNLDEMGKYNRFIAEKYISWNNKSKELLEFYKELI